MCSGRSHRTAVARPLGASRASGAAECEAELSVQALALIALIRLCVVGDALYVIGVGARPSHSGGGEVGVARHRFGEYGVEQVGLRGLQLYEATEHRQQVDEFAVPFRRPGRCVDVVQRAGAAAARVALAIVEPRFDDFSAPTV